MSPEVAARVFEPFFTTKEVGKGSGLGLSMVYGFVRQSGGHVNIYSEEGRGTAVRIYLPRAEAKGERAPDQAAGPLPRGTETVLVVEDDPLVRELAVGMIRRLNYEVVVATDGPSALAVLDGDRQIDLMFSDIVMPGGMSGPDLAAQARKRRPDLKVLFTSGYSEHTISRPGKPTLDFPLLAKPYRVSDLANRIREILDSENRRQGTEDRLARTA
jgi:CheY-like chemotaxis protein